MTAVQQQSAWLLQFPSLHQSSSQGSSTEVQVSSSGTIPSPRVFTMTGPSGYDRIGGPLSVPQQLAR